MAAVVVVLVVSWARRRFGGGGGVGDGDGDGDVDFVLRIGLLAIEDEELRLRLSFGGDCGAGRELEGGVVGAADCLACQASRCSNSWRRRSSSLRRSCGRGFGFGSVCLRAGGASGGGGGVVGGGAGGAGGAGIGELEPE